MRRPRENSRYEIQAIDGCQKLGIWQHGETYWEYVCVCVCVCVCTGLASPRVSVLLVDPWQKTSRLILVMSQFVSWLCRHDFITCRFYVRLRLGFPVGVFSTDFSAKISYAFQIIRFSVEIVSSFGNFCGKQIQDVRFWMSRSSVGMHWRWLAAEVVSPGVISKVDGEKNGSFVEPWLCGCGIAQLVQCPGHGLCASRFNIQYNSTFCPHSVLCFVWVWEQTAIISVYSINCLVLITETECVYCAVRTWYLYIIQGYDDV